MLAESTFNCPEDLNKALYLLHKKLLTLSMQHNNSLEIGMHWDFRSNKIFYDIGDKTGIRVSEKTLMQLRNSTFRSVIFMHNHPMNHTFSTKDLETFCNDDTIEAITAVCNCGDIHMLRKGSNFNGNVVKNEYNKYVKKYGDKGGNRAFRALCKRASSLSFTYRCSVKRER